MIRMTKGTYGLVVDGSVEAMTQHSGPFSLSKEREAELVAAGVAEMVNDTEAQKPSKYDGMKMTELRKAAESVGVDASAAKTKREVIAMLEATEAEAKADTGATDEGQS